MEKNTFRTEVIFVKVRGKRYTVEIMVKRKFSEAIKKRLKERHRIEVLSQR
jgi:hypothetical protein